MSYSDYYDEEPEPEDDYWADGTPIPEDPEWNLPVVPDTPSFVTVHLRPTFPGPGIWHAIPCFVGQSTFVPMQFMIAGDGMPPFVASINVEVRVH